MGQIIKHPLLAERIKKMEQDFPAASNTQPIEKKHEENEVQDNREDADTRESSGSLDTMDDTLKTIMSIKTTNESEYEGIKPDTFKVLGAYSLQGPTSKGVTLFETDRIEDVNLYRNYFALAGARRRVPAVQKAGRHHREVR